MKKTTATLGLITALTLSLTACGGITGSESDGDPSGSNRPSSSSSSSVTPEPASDSAEADAADLEYSDQPGESAFGKAYTYSDGLSVKVGEPQPYTPDEWAAGGENHDQHVSFEVTIVNDTEAAFDPTFATSTVQSGNTEGDEVYDDTVGGAPGTSVLAGRETTYTVAYGVDDPADIVFEMSPSFEHVSVIFSNGGEE